jgi:hypothetical protein
MNYTKDRNRAGASRFLNKAGRNNKKSRTEFLIAWEGLS